MISQSSNSSFPHTFFPTFSSPSLHLLALQALRWIIMQANNLTDKSVIGEVGEGKVEAFATLAAVALTIYWSFKE